VVAEVLGCVIARLVEAEDVCDNDLGEDINVEEGVEERSADVALVNVVEATNLLGITRCMLQLACCSSGCRRRILGEVQVDLEHHCWLVGEVDPGTCIPLLGALQIV
jgi:hypothetical protein